MPYFHDLLNILHHSTTYSHINLFQRRSKEIEELKLCMDNIQSQMKSLHERYNLLSVSYTYLHDKFDTFQNLHSCKQSSKYIAEKKKCVSLSHSSNHTPRVSNDDNYHLSRIVSVDQSYRVRS